MLYNERVELILQQVQLQAIVKINDLKDLLNVSVDTVRRDLKTMEQSGLIKCIRGGACLPDSLPSLSNFTGREVLNIKLKREAAKKALAYINNYQFKSWRDLKKKFSIEVFAYDMNEAKSCQIKAKENAMIFAYEDDGVFYQEIKQGDINL